MLVYIFRGGWFVEIKRVKEESYESIKHYLDTILEMVPKLFELCFVDYDGKRYFVGFHEGEVAIVENSAGDLLRFLLTDNELVKKFETEESIYEILDESSIKEVRRTNKLTKDEERLSYIPKVLECPYDIIEYVQYLDRVEASLTSKYDVTNKTDLNYALRYTHYHYPVYFALRELKKVLFWYSTKKHFFSQAVDVNGFNMDAYVQPLLRLGESVLIGSKPTLYDCNDIVERFSKQGFNENIPDDLESMLLGKNSTYKTLAIVADTYKNFIKGQ